MGAYSSNTRVVIVAPRVLQKIYSPCRLASTGEPLLITPISLPLPDSTLLGRMPKGRPRNNKQLAPHLLAPSACALTFLRPRIQRDRRKESHGQTVRLMIVCIASEVRSYLAP